MLQAVLRRSGAYEMSRRLIGAHREMELVTRDHVRPVPGLRILDVGCGNGRLVEFLPEGIDYVGIDHNPSYIAAATERYGSATTRFVCADLSEVSFDDVEPVDVAVAIGVLHHLDDPTASRTVAAAAARLRPGGRLVTLDPCFEPSQRQGARVLMALDRGRFVRHPANYVSLIEPHVGAVSTWIHDDVFAFPYTHLLTESVVDR